MGTEVLRPHDCLLTQRIRVSPTVFPRRRNYYYHHTHGSGIPKAAVNNNNNNNNNRRSSARFEQQRRRTPDVLISKRSASTGDLRYKRSQNNTINKSNSNNNLAKGTEMAPKPIRVGLPDVYAGSGFSMSPSPRALPLPSFFNKRDDDVDDSATRDLRRLLRLD